MRLTLIRHAEAASGDEVADHERPLTGAGRQQAHALGRWLAEQGERPSVLHCSSARRVLETVEAMLSLLPAGARPEASRDLYLASAGQLLERVRETPSAHASLWIVGHNPGMAELSLRLAGQGEAPALRRMAGRFPPAACVRITFSHDQWSAVEPGARGPWTARAPEESRESPRPRLSAEIRSPCA